MHSNFIRQLLKVLEVELCARSPNTVQAEHRMPRNATRRGSAVFPHSMPRSTTILSQTSPRDWPPISCNARRPRIFLYPPKLPPFQTLDDWRWPHLRKLFRALGHASPGHGVRMVENVARERLSAGPGERPERGGETQRVQHRLGGVPEGRGVVGAPIGQFGTGRRPENPALRPNQRRKPRIRRRHAEYRIARHAMNTKQSPRKDCGRLKLSRRQSSPASAGGWGR